MIIKFSSPLLFACLAACTFNLNAQDVRSDSSSTGAEEWAWKTVETNGLPTARHEASLVAVGGKLYLIGGRRVNPVNVYDPKTNAWTAKSKPPIELHHFQAVVFEKKIFLVGAFTGKFPNEKPVKKVVVYDPVSDKFEFTHTIPPARRRGAAGVVVHDGKLYVAGGITNGHVGGTRNWLDCYDPKTGDWQPLANAPHKRDHAAMVVCNDHLCFLAGRQTRNVKGFGAPTVACDFYDLKQKKWVDHTVSLPTERAGNMALAWGDEIIIGGGESGAQKQAHRELEAYNLVTKKWRRWPDLIRGRHGSSFAVVGDFVYTASGSGNRGGGPELTSLERLRLPPLSPQPTNQTDARK